MKFPVLIVVVLLLAAAVGFYFFGSNLQSGNPISPEERARLTKLVENATRGIAHMENHEWDQADEIFTKLAEAETQEVLPVQNLAITRTMRLTSVTSKLNATDSPVEFEAALGSAREAIEQLKQRDSDSSLAGILSGELSMKLAALPLPDSVRDTFDARYESAFRSYQQATKADPNNATAMYKMHDASLFTEDDSMLSAGLDALRKAGELEPDNIWILKVLLWSLADNGDNSVVEILERTKTVVAPLAERFQQINNRDLPDIIDKAIESAKAGKPQMARQVGNLLMGDIASQIDRRRIDRNLLEFISFEFSEHTQSRIDRLGIQPGSDNADINVKFLPDDSEFPRLKGVADVCLVDMDLDTRQELVIVREGKVEVYSRNESGEWSLVSESPELGNITGLIAADLDRDFDNSYEPKFTARTAAENKRALVPVDVDVDIVAFGPDGAFILQNTKAEDDSRSLDLTEQTDGIGTLKNVTAAAAIDFDHDGDLDLVFATPDGVDFRINHERFRFGDGNAHIGKMPGGAVTSMIPIDWDRDVDIDLLCSTTKGVGVYENLTHSRFRFVPLKDDVMIGESQQVISGDFDANASWDVLRLASAGSPGLILTGTTRTGSVSTIKSSSVDVELQAKGLGFDFDNDGRQDVLTWSQDTISLSRGTGSSFVHSDALSDFKGGATACDVGDLDQDGDLDLAIVNDGGVRLFTNAGGEANNSIFLTLRSEKNPEQFPSQRVNMHGVGSTVEMRAGAQYLATVVDRPVTHLGLGKRDAAELIRIIWTDGAPENVVAPASGTPILAQQELKGSCPYLYTWNGEKFAFCTDCAWAAPIGLQQAEGKLMPPREWEYLKIRGAELRAKDGRYLLQVTEELWEAAYFDQIRLIAVDHPKEIDVFSNEKVGPASIAEFKVHTVKNAKLPVAAFDKHGNDILELLEKRDGIYHRGYDQRTTQGLAETQILELDPGKLNQPKSIRLFLTGWLMPTDTSLNIAISQNPDLNSPKPPAIQVRDENGEWKETIPFCGFPGGKTKTIAIDLSNAFLTDDYRIRLVTQMELKWDAAFFTVDEEPAEFKTNDLPLVAADLHYRGFSQRRLGQSHGPEQFDYSKVSTDPKWAPMQGRFTRYGDVLDLLTSADDQLIVMGSGDEVTLQFESGPPIPDGWTRDFLMYNVGWDKDADLNTVTGQSSEPYPFAGMKSYPPFDETPGPDGYSEYIQTYQNREQDDRLFRNLLRFQKTPPGEVLPSPVTK